MKNHLSQMVPGQKHFLDLTVEEQQEQNEFDLQEMKNYYGSWQEVEKIIARLKDREDEAAFELYQESQYGGDGIFADNH